MKKYAWRTGFHASASADAVMTELVRLGVRDCGLTAELVLDQARDKNSLLHGFFEWDDSVAAEKYRVEQAQSLIRAIVVLPEENTTPALIRAVVRVGDGQEKGRYWETERAMSDEQMSRRVLLDAARDAQAMSARYRALSKYSEKLQICADRFDELASWLIEEPETA